MIELQYADVDYMLLRDKDGWAKSNYTKYFEEEKYPMIVCVVDDGLYRIKHVSTCLSELRVTSDDINDFLSECTKVLGSL